MPPFITGGVTFLLAFLRRPIVARWRLCGRLSVAPLAGWLASGWHTLKAPASLSLAGWPQRPKERANERPSLAGALLCICVSMSLCVSVSVSVYVGRLYGRLALTVSGWLYLAPQRFQDGALCGLCAMFSAGAL